MSLGCVCRQLIFHLSVVGINNGGGKDEQNRAVYRTSRNYNRAGSQRPRRHKTGDMNQTKRESWNRNKQCYRKDRRTAKKPETNISITSLCFGVALMKENMEL